MFLPSERLDAMAWELYDELIAGVPEGIAVTDFCLGVNWCYVDAECGMGIAKTVQDGARRSEYRGDPRDLDLRGLAALTKSWHFSEASLGVAALNAWYSQIGRLQGFGAQVDSGESHAGKDQNPFSFLRQGYEGKKLAVVGHFPNVEAAARVAQVTVLERNCTSALDVPDPACEFILPEQDFAFVTGTTLSNKTMPRLLQLCQHPFTVITGPSAIPSQVLIDAGANMIAGSVVVDAEQAKLAVRGGSKQQWRIGIKKFSWEP
jgi:uncharacterized protein (DUF4213/DUF364 family)